MLFPGTNFGSRELNKLAPKSRFLDFVIPIGLPLKVEKRCPRWRARWPPKLAGGSTAVKKRLEPKELRSRDNPQKLRDPTPT